MRISVVLPAPFSPKRAWIVPACRRNETSSSTTGPRKKDLVTFDIRSASRPDALRSKSGRCIDEGGRNVEPSGYSLAESADTQRFCRVVPRVQNDNTEIPRLDRRVMRPFADDKGVEPSLGRFAQCRGVGARAGAEPPSPCDMIAIERRGDQRTAELPGELRGTVGECACRNLRTPTQPNVPLLERSKPSARLQPEFPREEGVVPQLGMHVERQVCRIDGDVVLDKGANAWISVSDNGLRHSPTTPVLKAQHSLRQ